MALWAGFSSERVAELLLCLRAVVPTGFELFRFYK